MVEDKKPFYIIGSIVLVWILIIVVFLFVTKTPADIPALSEPLCNELGFTSFRVDNPNNQVYCYNTGTDWQIVSYEDVYDYKQFLARHNITVS